MGSFLNNPPKLIGLDSGQGPQTVSEWITLYRWLITLWRQAQTSTTEQEAASFVPILPAVTPPGVIRMSVAAGDPPSPQRLYPDSFTQLISGSQNPAPQLPDNLASFLLAGQQVPYPPPVSQVNPRPYGIVVQGYHADRFSIGTGTVSGSTLTLATGPNFNSSWVGFAISINGALFPVASWTSGTILTVVGTPPAGAVGWEFMMYPANTLPAGSAFMEIDHNVIYRIGDSSGVCSVSHYTITWVSGPLFSPYWGGLTFNLNGINFTVAYSTANVLTLTADTGLVLPSQGWTVASSNWFYEAGTETLSFAQWAARGWYQMDDGYRADIYDYNHLILYNGISGLWAFADGDAGSGYIVASANAATPQGGPWQFCDGTVIGVFQIVAGVPQVNNITTPTLTLDTFLRGAYFTGSTDAGSSPSFSCTGLTFAGTPATLTGTVSQPTFAGTPDTLTGTVSQPTFTGTPATLTGTVSQPTFAGNAMSTHQHEVPISITSGLALSSAVYGTSGSHPGASGLTGTGTSGTIPGTLSSGISAGTPTGTVSQPTLSMNSYTPAGTVSQPTLSMNSYTPAGTVSQPTLSMNSYTPAGTIGGTGTVGAPTVGSGAPKSLALQWYMRR